MTISLGQTLSHDGDKATPSASATRGGRLARVDWAQSRIRQPGRREILFGLYVAFETPLSRAGKSETFDRLAGTR